MSVPNLAFKVPRSWPRLDQERIGLVVTSLLVASLVVVPLLFLFRVSMAPVGTLRFSAFALTLDNYRNILDDPATFRLLKNTLVYAGGSVVEALLISFTLAWISERSDMRWAAAIRVAMFGTLAIPTLAMTFGWIMLLNPGNGVFNVIARGLFGWDNGPFDIYTMEMMIFVSGLMLAPTAYVILCGLLRNMDPALENAAYVAGSARRTVMWQVTLPLIAPGILSVGIYTIMLMIQVFDTPFLIGLTAGVPVLSTRIYALSSPEDGTPDYGLAAAFGVYLLALALLLMWGYYRSIRGAERFRVVTGRGFRPRRISLGKWRYAAGGFTLLYFVLMALPILILLWTSLLPFYQLPSVQALGRLTFANYVGVANMNMIRRAVGNTIVAVFCTATVGMILAGLVSWYSVRSRIRGTRYLDLLAFTPMAIPAIVMGLAVLLAYISTPIYGTIWIIVLAQVTVCAPFGTRMMSGALIQIHKDLENAAGTCGASWLTSLRTIIFPLLLPHFLNGWLWMVGSSTRDLTIPFLLRTTDNVMISPAMLQIWNTPNYPGASAVAILMTLALMAIVVPVQIFVARREAR